MSAATAFITGEGSVTGGVAAAIAARLGWEARLAMENTAAATRRLFARATGWACYASPAFSGRYRAGFGLAALSRGFRACRAIARVSGLPRYRAGFGLAALSRGFRACRAIARVSGLPRYRAGFGLAALSRGFRACRLTASDKRAMGGGRVCGIP